MKNGQEYSEEYKRACAEMRSSVQHFNDTLAKDPEMRAWVEKMRKVASEKK